MKKHTCRQCGSTFEYCRGCLLSPIPYKDAGYCSKSCYEASKNKVVIEPVEEEIVTEVIVEDTKPIEEEVSVEVEAETVALTETSVVEATTVAEPTIKKETYNTYKKKKHKYR